MGLDAIFLFAKISGTHSTEENVMVSYVPRLDKYFIEFSWKTLACNLPVTTFSSSTIFCFISHLLFSAYIHDREMHHDKLKAEKH